MPKIDIDGWKADKTRRADRVAKNLCLMCGQPKRDADQYDTDDCKKLDALGMASKS